MKALSIYEINDLDDGDVIPAVEGMAVEVYQRNSGTNEKGDWSVQDCVLESEGESIKVKFWNHEDLSDLQGKNVRLEAHKSKSGLTSLFANDDTYKGKTTRLIRATAACKIIVGVESLRVTEPIMHGSYQGKGGADPDWPEAPASHKATQDAPAHAPESPPARSSFDGGVQEAREHLMKAANLYNLCVACVEKAISPTIPQIGQTSEMFQAAVGTLFIEASRAGYVSKMPSKPL